MGPKIRSSVLGNVYSKTKDISNNVNSILFTNGWVDKMIELDIKAVFMALCELHTK